MGTFSRLVHTVRPSFDGRYLVDHLACGEYFTAASGDLEDGEWFDRPTCQGLPGTTLRMAITRGQRHNANLRGE